MDSFIINNYKNISVDDLTSLDNNAYKLEMANLLKLGLIRDAGFYEWIILNFQDILDKDEKALSYIISKVQIIMQFFEAKGEREARMLKYGELFAKVLLEVVPSITNFSDALSLGIIATSHISYKREMLSWEEFYEVRDMFVPFDLPISLDKYDVDKATKLLTETLCVNDVFEEFVLLKKIGKAVFVKDIKEEELKEAFNHLIVEWN